MRVDIKREIIRREKLHNPTSDFSIFDCLHYRLRSLNTNKQTLLRCHPLLIKGFQFLVMLQIKWCVCVYQYHIVWVMVFIGNLCSFPSIDKAYLNVLVVISKLLGQFILGMRQLPRMNILVF
jgi:hypothetical protein